LLPPVEDVPPFADVPPLAAWVPPVTALLPPVDVIPPATALLLVVVPPVLATTLTKEEVPPKDTADVPELVPPPTLLVTLDVVFVGKPPIAVSELPLPPSLPLQAPSAAALHKPKVKPRARLD
jgi:hypothetical protein